MELEELKQILENEDSIIGEFNDKDIDFFIKEDYSNRYSHVSVNNLIVPFQRICLGLQDLKGTDSSLLFICNYKEVQVKIKDIETLEFNPTFVVY